MADTAGWIALAATCLAAMMTASNLGARVTGWGFVIFTGGAIAWIIVGAATGQKQLLLSNVFLGAVDLFGVWRWLGRRARISDASRAEEHRSTTVPGETLFSTASLDGLPVKTRNGQVVATATDALAACRGGEIGFLIVRIGGFAGVGERLHKLPWADVQVGDGEVTTDLDAEELSRLPAARLSTDAETD